MISHSLISVETPMIGWHLQANMKMIENAWTEATSYWSFCYMLTCMKCSSEAGNVEIRKCLRVATIFILFYPIDS